MKRSAYVLSVLLIAATVGVALWGADRRIEAEPQFTVEITAPEQDAQVVGEPMVKGTAVIPSGNHLWVLVHRKDFKTVWWPQREAEIDPRTKEWEARAVLGGPQDIGWEFEIAAITVDGKEHAKLVVYWTNAMQSEKWPPIIMPPTTSAPKILKFTKIK